METVAPGDEIAFEHLLVPSWPNQHERLLRFDLLDPDVFHLEQQRLLGAEPRLDQVLHDLGLPVDRDRLAASERRHVDPVPLAGELQLDASVHEPFARHPLPHACLDEEIDDALLEHPGPNPGLDVLAAPVLQDHRLDALQMQQLGERQACGPRADDRNLRPRQGAVSR